MAKSLLELSQIFGVITETGNLKDLQKEVDLLKANSVQNHTAGIAKGGFKIVNSDELKIYSKIDTNNKGDLVVRVEKLADDTVLFVIKAENNYKDSFDNNNILFNFEGNLTSFKTPPKLSHAGDFLKGFVKLGTFYLLDFRFGGSLQKLEGKEKNILTISQIGDPVASDFSFLDKREKIKDHLEKEIKENEEDTAKNQIVSLRQMSDYIQAEYQNKNKHHKLYPYVAADGAEALEEFFIVLNGTRVDVQALIDIAKYTAEADLIEEVHYTNLQSPMVQESLPTRATISDNTFIFETPTKENIGKHYISDNIVDLLDFSGNQIEVAAGWYFANFFGVTWQLIKPGSELATLAEVLSEDFANFSTVKTVSLANLHQFQKKHVSSIYSNKKSYKLGEIVFYTGSFYENKEAILIPESFDLDKWTEHFTINKNLEAKQKKEIREIIKIPLDGIIQNYTSQSAAIADLQNLNTGEQIKIGVLIFKKMIAQGVSFFDNFETTMQTIILNTLQNVASLNSNNDYKNLKSGSTIFVDCEAVDLHNQRKYDIKSKFIKTGTIDDSDGVFIREWIVGDHDYVFDGSPAHEQSLKNLFSKIYEKNDQFHISGTLVKIIEIDSKTVELEEQIEAEPSSSLTFSSANDDWMNSSTAKAASAGTSANIFYYRTFGGAYSEDSSVVPTDEDTFILSADHNIRNDSRSPNKVGLYSSYTELYSHANYARYLDNKYLIYRGKRFLYWGTQANLDNDIVVDANLLFSETFNMPIFGYGDPSKAGTLAFHGAGWWFRKNGSTNKLKVYKPDRSGSITKEVQIRNPNDEPNKINYFWFRIAMGSKGGGLYDIRIFQNGNHIHTSLDVPCQANWVVGLQGMRGDNEGWSMIQEVRMREGSSIAENDDNDISGDEVFKANWVKKIGNHWQEETTVNKLEQWLKGADGLWYRTFQK